MYETTITDWLGQTTEFFHPYLDHAGRGLVAGTHCWVPRPDAAPVAEGTDGRYVVRTVWTVFPDGWDAHNLDHGLVDIPVKGVHFLPLTAANIDAFLSLPFVEDADKVRLIEERLYVKALRKACIAFLADRSYTEPDPEVPGGVHRRVMAERTVTRVVPGRPAVPAVPGSPAVPEVPPVDAVYAVRPLTDVERMKLRSGRPVPSAAERTYLVSPAVPGSPAVPEVLPVDALPAVPDTVETTTVSYPCPRHAAWQRYTVPGLRLYSQQVQGCEIAYLLRRLPIWYTMRTGKTPLALAVAYRLRAEGELKVLIIVCKKGLMYSPWLSEPERFGFPVYMLDGSPEEDEAAIHTCAQKGGCIVINFERVLDRSAFFHAAFDADRTNDYTPACDWTQVGLIADETSQVKNPDARRTKALYEFGRMPLCLLLLLNGTPVNQGSMDYWSQAHICDPFGTIWGRDYNEFDRMWLRHYGSKSSVIPAKNMAFQTLLATTSIRCITSEADQFNGRDKTFRYPKIRATPAMVAQARNIEAGFVQLLDGSLGEVSTNMMVVYGALRELCAGYSKWKDGPGSGLPYHRERLAVDPKLLWVEAYLLANPGQPVVFGTEFNEQEMMLVELLDRLGITWTGTSERPTYTWERFITAEVSGPEWVACREYLRGQARAGWYAYPDWDEGASAWSSFRPAVDWFERTYPRLVTRLSVGTPGKKRSAQARAVAESDFQEGRVQCYICKNVEGMGVTLNRLPAVLREESLFPDIILLSPPWSLIAWDQMSERCMGSDPRTNKSINTPIYALGIHGSMDQHVMDALRSKKDVQAALLQDAARVGYRNFVHDLVEGMAGADDEDPADRFDTSDMLARIVLGIAPYAKVTENAVYAALGELMSVSKKKAAEWLGTCPAGFVPTFEDKDGHMVRPQRDQPDSVRAAAWYLLQHLEAPRDVRVAAK